MTTEQTKNFILAGRAVFTISNGKPAPDARDYTFKVTRKTDPGRAGNLYFVGLLTGSDNDSDYTYLGMLDHVTGWTRPTAKSTLLSTSTPFVALNWALGLIWAGKPLSGNARLQHVGRCGKCNRALTVPESIDSGLGPECSGLGYTKPRNERKPRTRKAPKPTFEQLRAQAASAALAADGGLGLPTAPAVELITYDDAAERDADRATDLDLSDVEHLPMLSTAQRQRMVDHDARLLAIDFVNGLDSVDLAEIALGVQ